jgi:hypothetical protein
VLNNEELEKAQAFEKFDVRNEVSEYLYEYQPPEDSFNMNCSTSTKVSAAPSRGKNAKASFANKKRQSINSSMLSMADRETPMALLGTCET